MTHRTFSTIGAALAALSLASTAAGYEPPVGSRLGDRLEASSNSNTDETRTAFRFAQCQANKHGPKVREILDAPSEDRVHRAREALEHEESCYFDVYVDPRAEKVRVSMSDASYRGMLAEGVLKAEGRSAALKPMALQAVYERPWTALTGRPPSVDEMAICVAEVNPAGIMAVLETLPESKEERAALSNLSGAMGDCLQNGVALSSDAIALRTAFAEALYHRAYDAPVGAMADATGAKKVYQ